MALYEENKYTTGSGLDIKHHTQKSLTDVINSECDNKTQCTI